MKLGYWMAILVGICVGAILCSWAIDEFESLQKRHEEHLEASRLMAESLQDLDKRVKLLEMKK